MKNIESRKSQYHTVGNPPPQCEKVLTKIEHFMESAVYIRKRTELKSICAKINPDYKNVKAFDDFIRYLLNMSVLLEDKENDALYFDAARSHVLIQCLGRREITEVTTELDERLTPFRELAGFTTPEVLANPHIHFEHETEEETDMGIGQGSAAVRQEADTGLNEDEEGADNGDAIPDIKAHERTFILYMLPHEEQLWKHCVTRQMQSGTAMFALPRSAKALLDMLKVNLSLGEQLLVGNGDILVETLKRLVDGGALATDGCGGYHIIGKASDYNIFSITKRPERGISEEVLSAIRKVQSGEIELPSRWIQRRLMPRILKHFPSFKLNEERTRKAFLSYGADDFRQGFGIIHKNPRTETYEVAVKGFEPYIMKIAPTTEWGRRNARDIPETSAVIVGRMDVKNGPATLVKTAPATVAPPPPPPPPTPEPGNGDVTQRLAEIRTELADVRQRRVVLENRERELVAEEESIMRTLKEEIARKLEAGKKAREELAAKLKAKEEEEAALLALQESLNR